MSRWVLIFGILWFSITTDGQDQTGIFIFGHSLIDHRPPAIPTPSDETTVPHWMYLLAKEAQHELAAGGQYGFLPQHAILPPIAQWGYDSVPGVWDSDNEPFSEAGITTVMITAGNFVQWQGPEMEYPSDPGVSPISATIDILDWVHQQDGSISFYLYENWPDMAGFLQNGFPPSSGEFENYNDYLLDDFHEWWIAYQDALLLARPAINVRMIPVGPILSKLLSDPSHGLTGIPMTELYEDDAPHGRASLYFLSALISYMAIFEEEAPASFQLPEILHADIRTNYTGVVEFIWSELQNFNLSNGDSRVFNQEVTNSADLVLSMDCISLYPNPTEGLFQVEGLLSNYDIHLLDSNGNIHQTLNTTMEEITIDIASLPDGLYFIRTVHKGNGDLGFQKILKID